MVRARSAAEMPVVTPSRASIDTVKAVWWRDAFCLDISGSRSCSIRSPVMARQIRPRPKRAMKLIAVGCGALGRDDQIALVLPVLVVDQDEHAALTGLLKDFLDGREIGLIGRIA